MTRDILSEYGSDSGVGDKPRATNGGRMDPKPISYSPPVGPKQIEGPKGPGLHANNYGNNVCQGKH